MAERRRESGRARQKRIEREQHRPEQNAGYDDAVHGHPPVKLDITDTTANDNPASRSDREVDRAAEDAARDVRRHDRSAG
jgi:hypothetical protein